MTSGGDGDVVRIEVVFAAPDRQQLLSVDVAAGSTVADAIDASGLATRFPDYSFEDLKFGIWGRTVNADHPVLSGDRIEIYRQLLIDPREARRDLASQGLSMGHGGDDS